MPREEMQWHYLTAFVTSGKIDTVDDKPLSDSTYHDSETEQEFLEAVGDEGWELITVVPAPQVGRYKLYFKMRVK